MLEFYQCHIIIWELCHWYNIDVCIIKISHKKDVCEKTALYRKAEIYLMDCSANENVKHYLAKWFFPHKSINLEPSLVGITSTKNLNSFEISKFNINKLDINDYLFGYGNPSDFSFGKNYNWLLYTDRK